MSLIETHATDDIKLTDAPPVLARIRVVLCRTSHPGNIGAVARAMMNMGLHELVLVDPAVPNFARSTETIQRASGATGVLNDARVVATLEEALADCVLAIACTARARDLTHQTGTVRHACGEALGLVASDPQHRIALVFGNERSGLSNEEVLLCNRTAHIPANPNFSSLNLAAAVQVFAYECRVAAGETAVPASKSDSFPLATHEGLEGFYAHLESTLVAIGYIDPHNPRRLMPRFRRLFGRARVEKEEIDLLRGILTRVTHPRRDG